MQTQILGRDALVAAWRSLAVRADFTDAGYELGPVGDVIVSREQDPWHQIRVTDVFCQLATQLGPRVALRLPVVTRSLGVRVPDVVWMPDEKWPDVNDDTPLAIAPDLCVELLSGNAVRACSIDNRVSAYLHSGAEEVIVVGHDGSIEFRGRDGIRSSSIYKVRLVLDTPILETAEALVGFASAGSSSKTNSYPTVIHGPMLKKDGSTDDATVD
jgi:hypothetical protein